MRSLVKFMCGNFFYLNFFSLSQLMKIITTIHRYVSSDENKNFLNLMCFPGNVLYLSKNALINVT